MPTSGHVRAAADEGVVYDVHVAGVQVFLAELIHNGADHGGDHADEAGDAVALGEQAALRVGDAAGVVERLVDYGAHRGLGKGVEDLIADRYERVLDDIEGDGADIELAGHLLHLHFDDKIAELVHTEALAGADDRSRRRLFDHERAFGPGARAELCPVVDWRFEPAVAGEEDAARLLEGGAYISLVRGYLAAARACAGGRRPRGGGSRSQPGCPAG